MGRKASAHIFFLDYFKDFLNQQDAIFHLSHCQSWSILEATWKQALSGTIWWEKNVVIGIVFWMKIE